MSERELIVNKILELQEPVLAYAKCLTKDSDLAEDLVQDVNEKLLNKLDYLHYENIQSFFLATIKNTFISDYRKRYNGVTFNLDREDYLEIGGLEVTDSDCNIQNINNKLDELPSNQREAIRYMTDGLKYSEIASRMGIPIGTVKSLIYLGRCQLRDELTEYREDFKF